ncbi:arginine exporter protein [Legionella donaldsonii]|uniref:Arginine exporter protein n=1 Tax=Legionella donaldsonii TaxID=45060 RepID=A0A378J5H1_9GAMM|nr:LysE family transporter [Legionella donaldsonii]STX42993.1 arginine exporter protein [Legionella donaldsonii]
MITLFLKGLIVGIAIAAPVGPIGILCIQRSLHNGFQIGLMSGLGAALADSVYGIIAGFGLTALSSFLLTQQFWIRLIGGLFLLYFGITLFLANPKARATRDEERSLWNAFATTFLLTLTNPATILSFMAIFAGLGLGSTATDFIHAFLLVSGITLGSALWWLLLSSFVAFKLRHRLSPKVMSYINRVSGIIILFFGIFALSMR